MQFKRLIIPTVVKRAQAKDWIKTLKAEKEIILWETKALENVANLFDGNKHLKQKKQRTKSKIKTTSKTEGNRYRLKTEIKTNKYHNKELKQQLKQQKKKLQRQKLKQKKNVI